MNAYTGVDDITLASEIAHCLKAEAEIRDTRQHRERELQHRLEARGALELPHPDLVVKLEYPSPIYDVSRLRGLAELLPSEVIDLASTPEHLETVLVREKWDARVFRTWGSKYGDAVSQVIEGAKMPSGPGRLRVTEKAGRRKTA